jgi:hypothetical protein
MRWLIILLVCGLTTGALHGQTIHLSDSLRAVFRQRITPSFKFDTRNSFITGNSAKVYGIKAGISFGKRFSVGVGYNFIGTELQETIVVNEKYVSADIRMNYVAPFIEYSFYQRGPWELVTPIQIGVGNSFLQYSTEEGQRVINKSSVVLYEPGMAFEYKIMKMLGVGVGLGYRIMLKNNRGIEQQFTSPVYALRVRLIFDELYRRYKDYSETEEAK